MKSEHRLLYIVTHAMTARHLLKGQLAWMREQGFEVAVCASPGMGLGEVARREGVTVFPVEMAREIDPLRDSRSIIRLHALMREWRPTIVNAATPKAGLLGMVAARMARVPVRIFHQYGLRLETTTGMKRALLMATERVTSACAHQVVAVSHSLGRQYEALGLAPAGKIRVLGGGSSNGLDFERFASPEPGVVAALRDRLGLAGGAPVIGFVGRFTRDKGIVELVSAFDSLRTAIPEAQLMLVGDFEKGDPVPDQTVERIRTDPAIVNPGFAGDSAPYYTLMDVLAFPSYREGFPNTPLEAAAAGIPAVGFKATGTVDAVVDGVTGTLVDVGDVAGLASALKRYLSDEALCRKHGEAGRRRVRKEFDPERVWGLMLEEYIQLLSATGQSLPIPSSETTGIAA